MQCTTKIYDDLYYVGGSDRRLSKFENSFPIPRGITYNSYLLLDEKTVLLDAVDNSIGTQFFENIAYVLKDRKLDYLIVNHMEPDHCSTIEQIVLRYPEVTLVGNKKTLSIMNQFYDFDVSSRFLTVKDNGSLNTGIHNFKFHMTPMVHWPESMITYDEKYKILFSGDAFGSFGAISGNLFVDELNYESEWLPDARRYYANVIGKYGSQVQLTLKTISELDVEMICPLHGPIWRSDVCYIIDKYNKWSTYTPEENSVLIVYASIYGQTENAAMYLANKMGQGGITNIAMYDVSNTHTSYLVSEAFRCSHIIFASSTYNLEIFPAMEALLLDLKLYNLQNRKVALIQNGTWTATAGKQMHHILSSMKNITFLNDMFTVKSALKQDQLEELDSIAQTVINSVSGVISIAPVAPTTGGSRTAIVNYDDFIENASMYKLSYGLFVLTARDCDKDNGCITNTLIQVSSTPRRASFAINKDNLTHDMILRTKVCNASIISESATFDLFKHFGFQSGRDTDKFADNSISGVSESTRTDNGVYYIKNHTNAILSLNVIATTDLGSHTLFIADITYGKVISDVPSATYAYYQDKIKPKPSKNKDSKKGYVCKICGYVYEGDPLPADYICPICKHGAIDFEPLE